MKCGAVPMALVCVLMLAGCATTARTREFPPTPEGLRAAADILISQPEGTTGTLDVIMTPQALPAPRNAIVDLNGLFDRKMLEGWTDAPCPDPEERCGIPANVETIVLLHPAGGEQSTEIATFDPTRNGLVHALDYLSVREGSRVFASVFPETTGEFYVGYFDLTDRINTDEEIVCGRFRQSSFQSCFHVAQVDSVSVRGSGELSNGPFETGPDLHSALNRLDQGAFEGQEFRLGVRTRDVRTPRYTFYEVSEVDELEMCGQSFNHELSGNFVGCLSFADIEKFRLRDRNRTAGEVASDTMLLPFRFLGAAASPS